MKTGMKVALLSFLCVLAHGEDSNATESFAYENENPSKVMLGVPVEVLDEEGKESIENFVKTSRERSEFEAATLKRVKSLYAIEKAYKEAKVMVENMKEVADNPEPFIVKRQIELLDKDIKMYKSLNMTEKVKDFELMKKNINHEKGMK